MLSSDCESDPLSETIGARDGPAAVALHGVDLAVVGEVAVGVRESPLRQRVGREALVEHHDRGLHARILQVGVELRQILRHDHALVDDRARRQRRQVEHRVFALELLLGAPAREEQPAVQRRLIDVARGVDEYLVDPRQRLQRLGAAGLAVGRHRAKAGDGEFLGLQFRREDGARPCRPLRVAVQEHQTDAEALRQLQSGVAGDRSHELGRHLDQQTAAIAGLAVSGDRAAMGQAVQRTDRGLQQPVTGRVIEVGDQPETAGIPFVCLTAQPPVHRARIPVLPRKAG